MLKDNEKNFSRLHMIIDAIVLVLSYFLAWLIRFVGPMAATAVRTRSFQQYMLMLVLLYRFICCCIRLSHCILPCGCRGVGLYWLIL